MKPSKFEYQLAATLTECLEYLATDSEDVAIIAGGQSLVPLLNLRMARPDRVVDINNISELQEFRREKDTLFVGAMVRHNTVQTHEFFRSNIPLMSEAMESVAHVQIKTRGTLGGNLCNAHPASEMPAVMLALGARLRCRSKAAGDRIIPIEEFFVGAMDNALNSDELLCEVQIPVPLPYTGWAFQELARRHGDFAQCGAAVLIGMKDGRISYARIGLCSIAATPIRFKALEEWLIGRKIGEGPDEEVFKFSVENLIVEDDPNMSIKNKVKLASTLIARTVARAAERIPQVSLQKG